MKTLFRVLRQLGRRYFAHQVGRSAAELAYYLLFSLFPLLIFVNAAVSMLRLSTDTVSQALGAVLPAQAAELVNAYLTYIQGLDAPMLLYACLFLTVYAVSRAITSLLRALSRAYHMTNPPRTNLVMGVLLAVLLLVSMVALLVLLVVSDKLLLRIDRYIALPDLLLRLWRLLRVMVAPVYMLLVMACFYAAVSFRQYRFRQALPGAVFSVVLGFAASLGFSWYLGHAGRYSVLYGSLSAFMVLMLWLYLMGAVILLGGELNHILANRNHLSDKGE